MCVSLCTTVVHNTAQNTDNFPSNPTDNYHRSDDVYWRERGTFNRQCSIMVSTAFSSELTCNSNNMQNIVTVKCITVSYMQTVQQSFYTTASNTNYLIINSIQ